MQNDQYSDNQYWLPILIPILKYFNSFINCDRILENLPSTSAEQY